MKKLEKKKVISWALYDFAETPVSALYITFFWPIYITEHLGGNEFQVGLAMGLSLIAIALTVPFLGAISDAWGRRIPILIVSTVLTAIAIALTGYSGLIAALILGFLTRYLLTVDNNLYGAKIMDVASRERVGLVSGVGIGVGYTGTIVALLIAWPILNALGWESLEAIRAMFWQAFAFMLIFSLPLFLVVRDRPVPLERRVSMGTALKNGGTTLWGTLKSFRRFTALPRFLLASFIYNDAVNTTLVFLVLFAREVIGVSIQEFFAAFGIMAIGSAVGAVAFGRLSDKVGPKKSLSVALVGWIVAVGYLLFEPDFRDLMIAGIVGGAMLGGVWTLNRHMVTRLVPERKLGEVFGIEGFTERLSGVIGPIVFGGLVVLYGYTPGLILVLAFFVAGLILLQLVPEQAVREGDHAFGEEPD